MTRLLVKNFMNILSILPFTLRHFGKLSGHRLSVTRHVWLAGELSLRTMFVWRVMLH